MHDGKLIDPIAAIKFDMQRFGWSQTELAKLTGFPSNRVGQFLNKRRDLPLSFIRAYHKLPNTASLEVLLGGSEHINDSEQPHEDQLDLEDVLKS